MKARNSSLRNNFENILSVTQKPNKKFENLFEIQFLNEWTPRLLIQLINAPSFIDFPSYSSFYLEILEQFTDQSDILNIVLEHFKNDLSIEIEQRLKSHLYFEEQEIWRLLITSIMGLGELHLKGRYYGNLNLSSFVIIEEKNSINFKLLSPELISLNIKDKKRSNSQTYFSLEELRSMNNGANQRSEENMENDIYHLGLALLEMATFISITSCYDWDNFTINYKLLEKKVEIVENRYSRELAFLIKIMLNADFKKRPTIKELAILVKKFELLEGFYKKSDLKGFIQRNLKSNVCGNCVRNIRKKQDEFLDKSQESSLIESDGNKLYSENEKEWLNLQKNMTKNRSALKSIDNHNY